MKNNTKKKLELLNKIIKAKQEWEYKLVDILKKILLSLYK